MTARVDHPVARDYLEGRPLPADLEELRRAHIADGKLPSRIDTHRSHHPVLHRRGDALLSRNVSAHGQSTAMQREYASVDRLMQTGENPRLDVGTRV